MKYVFNQILIFGLIVGGLYFMACGYNNKVISLLAHVGTPWSIGVIMYLTACHLVNREEIDELKNKIEEMDKK